MSRLPRIGITPDINDTASPETEYVLRKNYADAVQNAGGLAFILAYSDQVEKYLDAIDGLVITGGMFDIDPVLYGQVAKKPYEMKPIRTDFERALIHGALAREMPILGICNGMQLLAVCLGGQLVQDIPTEICQALEHKPMQSATAAQHTVQFLGTSRHLPDLNGQTFSVNSVHHQSVLPSTQYKALARAPDGVLEALEARGGGFAIGVQWHPEYGVAEIDTVIFDNFLAKAREFSQKEL
ncbi:MULTISPECIES: gamma-glutamyl-gamma-aminobutyrate hydrolase family protein [Rhizobium]|uniref:gamma-glutamyl-gamma-aminobutyrate hydrolase family protein n=1 Tax=Rhizobium TaxID=379 RepID=UPI001F3B5BC8|nr:MULTISPECIES: gamma-glutamyl-gamma-aminobutyrate hydrolase family protein [Rhizobium]UIJ82321.1 phosphoribosylformylglycinamidine synthase subunit PurQ [Rhizobium leguminosarum]UTS88881.1 phosphoribosylformylglycinamidine synthase subunit PurQ [Rhizobium anhuiense bv. trifolii]